MIKRPARGETEEDILRMQQKFLKEKAKNPKLQSAAQFVKVEKAPKKSLFAQSRAKVQQPQIEKEKIIETTTAPNDSQSKLLLGEIHEKMLGDVNANDGGAAPSNITNIVLGDILEKSYAAAKQSAAATLENTPPFPKIEKTMLQLKPKPGKSIFALTMEANKAKGTLIERKRMHALEAMDCDEPIEKRNLSSIYGSVSVIVEDDKTAAEVHKQNLTVLSQMKEDEILAERRKLMESIDPALVALLAKKRQEKLTKEKPAIPAQATPTDVDQLTQLPQTNPAVEILERSNRENWINFDIIEKDKLEWMRDIPLQVQNLKPGEKFEARFDWKGVLLPYSDASTEKHRNANDDAVLVKDERELYLHGDEPHRPGYTLQELFRLARSNVMQQRVSAFGAIAGILNIYNQGFYDNVLELPISKIFFLLRFGLDDNMPAMVEVVTKAMAFLFYNETDEALLDFIFDNRGCHWQPTLLVLQNNAAAASEDMTTIENLQKQMQQLQMSAPGGNAAFAASIEETEEENKTSMSDFQLAETDLVDCLMRTNILQRIYFILHNVRPDNSTVSSCLKLLIRIARAGKESALQIAQQDLLVECLFENFLPGLQQVDTTLQTTPFYNYPQYLCLKLLRILIAQNLGIALKFVKLQLIDKLQSYLYNRDDIKTQLIKVQIECLRILRCLLLLRVDNALYKKFLPAYRYMLEWHYNHVIYDVTGPWLIRQHAAALLAAITASPATLEVTALLRDILHDCCCNWFHQATRCGVKEFSQTTLLTACLNAIVWCTRNSDSDWERFRNFNSRFLCDFIETSSFKQLIKTLTSSAIVLRSTIDRRNVHTPLPNVGAVLLHACGPQLVLPQTYAVHLLNALWRLLELQLARNERVLFKALLAPSIIEPLAQFLQALCTEMQRYSATNFFAKTELKFIFQLLCFESFSAYIGKPQMLQLVYSYLCCLTAEHITEIEQLFERVIFNTNYINVKERTLTRWRQTCLELVYAHSIVVPVTELTLAMPYTQAPVLPSDWPYFQLKIILQNYIDNVHQKTTAVFSEHEVLQMTLNFVAQLEACNPQMQIVTSTEKLMYLMIAFMGPDSQFLADDMQQLLRQHLERFYTQCQGHTFQFDTVFEGKCKFENLYALFVDHFQAASYGNELFGSLLLVPLAQKYDNKWRRRVWSDYASALSFLNCDENLLIGGLQAYLEPAETEESLIRAYAAALHTNLVRPNTIPYRIAQHHVTAFKAKFQK